MKKMLRIMLEVNLPEGCASANEFFDAMNSALVSIYEQGLGRIIEGYQDFVVGCLCERGHAPEKLAWAEHQDKRHPGQRCRGKRFVRSGSWTEDRRLRGEHAEIHFRPHIVKCVRCGKQLTPILAALELRAHQTRTDQLLWKVVEAVSESSYRRSIDQLSVLAEVPVAKSTAHRWAASVELPLQSSGSEDLLAADGTGFKNQATDKGQVRLVLKIGPNNEITPVGVWAGKSWEMIAQEVQDAQTGQARLFISDGERGVEEWLGRLAQGSQRCQWHAAREVGYALWEDGLAFRDRQPLQQRMAQLLAVEIPEEDVEFIGASEKADVQQKIEAAEKQIAELEANFAAQGYVKAATYIRRARDQLFSHLRLWTATGIIAPRTTSFVENLIRELVRRLKKLGWNWSDAGAERMGRFVMVRRYDQEGWRHFWGQQMNLRGRCKITLTQCELLEAA